MVFDGASTARPESRIEGAEQDVRHVVRPERSLLEDREELVADGYSRSE